VKRHDIRVLWIGGSPAAIGRAHGETFRDDIRAYAADRTRLSAAGTDWDRGRIMALAEQMLSAHEAYHPGLYAEMLAMAGAAGISPAEAVIVGGYTDFIDTVRAVAGGTAVEDTCTAVIVPDDLAGGAGFLAQTWDMHASATEHVVLLGLQPNDAPRSLVFTTVGTLGQIGMNEAGIAIGINNLTVDDGTIGVTWPFVVRKVLEQTSFEDAVSCVVDTPLAGGHNFLIFDGGGNGVSIEATPTTTHIERLATEPLVHTNHCLVPATQAVEGYRPAELQRSSEDRLRHAPEHLADRPVNAETLMALTRDERSICRHPEPPFDYESSGATILRPATGDFWACWGVPSENEYQHFRLSQSSGLPA
jgi:isopenicillin-N N-acyltransferase-like protein